MTANVHNCNVASELAEWVHSLQSSQIPKEASDAARSAVLDVIGCAAAGYAEEAPLASEVWSRRTFADGVCSLWFSHYRRNLVGAVFSNCAAASAMDGDDTHPSSFMHAGAAIVPTAVAATQQSGASGVEFLRSIVVGYEVVCRIASSLEWAAQKQIATGHWSSFGAASLLGWLNKTDAGTLSDAFAVCTALRPYVYAPDDNLNLNGIKEGVAWGTFAGVSAFEFANYGLTGPKNCLDPKLFRGEAILKGLPETWAINEVMVKPYSSCSCTHTPIDALLQLMKEHGFTARDVRRVVVTTYPLAVEHINNDAHPQTLEAAQYNIPFTLAVAAVDGVRALYPIKSTALRRVDLVDFARKVEVKIGERSRGDLRQFYWAEVSVDTNIGCFERSLDRQKSPRSFNEIVEKFRKMTDHIWTDPQQSELIDAVLRLEQGTDPLMEILSTPVLIRS